MSTLIVILIGVIVLLLGVGIGYYLRVIVALGKRKSIEIDIKQMMVGAKEEAQKIIDEAKNKARVLLDENEAPKPTTLESGGQVVDSKEREYYGIKFIDKTNSEVLNPMLNKK